MSDKIIGAVSLKVKPDTKNFRDEAERDLKKQLRGMDDKVTIKGKIDYDTDAAKRKLGDLQREARETIRVKVDVEGLDSRRWGDYARDAKKHLRDIASEQKKLDADAEMGIAKNWAKRKGELRKQAAEYKDLLKSITEQQKRASARDADLGFDGIQKAIDKIGASQVRIARISETSWDDTAKAVDRYKDALARLDDHEKNDDGSIAWTRQGVQLLDAVDAMEKQVASLKEQDATLSALQRRWDSLGRAQKNAVADVLTSENNADIEKAKQDIEDFRASLTDMGTMQVANLRNARLEAEKLSAVESELEARRRKLRAQHAFNGWDPNTTATPENQNTPLDDAYLRADKVRQYARELEKLTAVELKRLEKVSRESKTFGQQMTATEIAFIEQITDAEERHQMIRAEANRRRRQANFNGTQFDTSRQLSDLARIERETHASLARQSAAEKKLADQIRNADNEQLDRLLAASLQDANWHRESIKSYEVLTQLEKDLLEGIEDRAARQRILLDEQRRRQREAHYEDLMGLQRTHDELVKLRYEADRPGTGRAEWDSIKIKMDDDSIKQVERDYNELKRKIEDIEADVIANPTGFMAVAAQLKWLTRPRDVDIFVKVHGRSLAIAKDSLQSLAGLNVAKNVATGFEDAFRNLDDYILKMGKLGTVLGTVGSAALGAAGAIGSVGVGLVQSVGLLATLPTIAYAGAASFTVFKLAFSDFANAFSDIPIVAEQALKDLPPLARKAVEELRGTWTSIRVPVQEAFWGQMGDSIGQLKKRILPQIREGLKSLAPEAAKATKAVLDSYLEIADNGDLRRMLDNTGKMMGEAAKGAKPLFDAINTLGLRGSEYLPQFGKWMADGAKSFDEWIQKADEAGDINRWIEDGVQSVKDFSSAIGGAGKILGGFAKAATAAGGPTLGDLARGLNEVGDAVNAEPFKSRMSTLFEGAFKGVGNLTGGLKVMGAAVGESADFWAELLDVTTQVAAVNMGNIAKVLSNNYAQNGVLLAFEGMLELANELGPTFDNVGSIIGDVGRIANTSFGELAPIINTVTGAISEVVSNLSDGAIAAIPGLMAQVNSGFTVLGEVAGVAASAVGGLLEGFGSLPGPIQTVVTSLGAFLLLRGQLGRKLENFGNSKAISDMRNQLMLTRGMTKQVVDEVGRMGPASVVWNTAGDKVKTFAGQMRTSGERMGALKSVGSGLFGLLGGPWGIALGAATVAMGAWANSQAEARDRASELKGTVDQLTGASTAATEATLNTRLATEEISGWDKWTGATKTAAETADAFGVSQSELVRIVSEGGPEFDTLRDKLRQAESALLTTGGSTMRQTAALDEFASAIGTTSKEIGGANGIRNLAKFMDENRGALDEARAAAKAYNERITGVGEATGLSAGASKSLVDSLSAITSEASSAEQKISGLYNALDLLKGGTMSMDDAAYAFGKTMDSTVASFKELGKKNNLDGLVDAEGKFKSLRGAGGDLREGFKGVAKDLIGMGTAAAEAARDQGKGSAEIAKAARDAMQMSKDDIAALSDATGISGDKIRAILEGLTGQDWEIAAILSADNELFVKSKAEAEAAGKEFSEKDWQAILSGNGKDFEMAKQRAVDAGMEFRDQDFETLIKGNDQQFQEAVALAKNAGVDFSAGFYEAVLDGHPDEAIAAAGMARDAGLEFSNGIYQATLKGDANTFLTLVQSAGEKGREFADALYMAYLKANPDQATHSVESAKAFATAFANGDYEAVLQAINKTDLGVKEAAKLIANFTGRDYKAVLKALNETKAGVDSASKSANSVKQKNPTSIKAKDDTADGKRKAESNINSTKQSKVPGIKAKDETGAGKRKAESNINSAKQRSPIGIYASNKTGPGKSSALGALTGLSRYISVYGKYRGWASPPVLAALKVLVRPVMGALPFAKGGLLNGAGIPQAGLGFKAFADGGVESHVAQFSSPSSSTIRIWGEPETGGEAYIPLAASKRARSTAIWKETGKRLGVYADGGIEGAEAIPQRPQYNFEITNNYPVAEKTSTTINRALQYAGVPDFEQ